jgi:uncharacterized protein YecE (DUF72 family)
MWSHPKWFGTLLPSNIAKSDALNAYQRIFNSVEGNTSFYQLPETSTIEGWRQQVDPNFSFTFKFPRDISHAKNINGQAELLAQCLKRFALLEDQLGCLMLQLPASFSPERAPELEQFIRQLPSQFHYALELRHLAWFDKNRNERWLNLLLQKHSIDRVILDTRGLFSCQTPTDTLVMEVQAKKPRLPTHVVTTSDRPIIRFVGHPTLEKNREFLAPWIDKFVQWSSANIQPFIFFHMPDNAQAPWLADLFFDEFKQAYPELISGNLNVPELRNQQLSIF